MKLYVYFKNFWKKKSSELLRAAAFQCTAKVRSFKAHSCVILIISKIMIIFSWNQNKVS